MAQNIDKKQLVFSPDVEIEMLQVSFEDSAEISFTTKEGALYLGYCFQGHWQTQNAHDSVFDVTAGNMSCVFGHNVEWRSKFLESTTISALSLCIPLKKLEQTGHYANLDTLNTNGRLSWMGLVHASKSMLSSATAVAFAYKNFPEEQLMLESHVLSLIDSSLSFFFNEQKITGQNRISPKDMDRLQYARELLATHLDNPPTISTLASLCGINEYKLKQNFKSTFGVTIYNYSKGLRLDEAKRLMEREGHSVTEAATAVGYYSFGHFSRSYHQRFGVLPKDSLKKSEDRPFRI